MKLQHLLIVCLVLAACARRAPREDTPAEGALRLQLTAERARCANLEAALQQAGRTAIRLEFSVEELEGTLKLASAEIWGQGSSTSHHLSMAQRTLGNLRGDLENLNRTLLGLGQSPPGRERKPEHQPGH